ncbi:MAG: hypothetical protein M1579_04250, partial [Gammaproteobacteria bacterium]|nr:hypothetical protein [Gammaproteobacteria bacterium]
MNPTNQGYSIELDLCGKKSISNPVLQIANLCWVEADMDSLVKIMSEVVLSGGKQNSGYSGHQKALVNNAK